MSSHHFVTDGQEPALIVANGAQCSFDLLKQLLEWCPFVVALDGAYNKLLELQIKPDVVIGDFDSIAEYEALADIRYIKIDEQETTDLEKGLNFLIDEGFKDVNIVWATGNRLDHTLNNISIIAKYSALNIVLYDDYSRAFLLPSSFKKYYQKGQKISLLPLGKVESVKTAGLKYLLDNEGLDSSGRSGSSNEVAESGTIRIEHQSGKLILIESLND